MKYTYGMDLEQGVNEEEIKTDIAVKDLLQGDEQDVEYCSQQIRLNEQTILIAGYKHR